MGGGGLRETDLTFLLRGEGLIKGGRANGAFTVFVIVILSTSLSLESKVQYLGLFFKLNALITDQNYILYA